MRILDKCKEFYDYVVSIYGIDNDIILDRRESVDCYFYSDSNWSIIANNIVKNIMYYVLEIGNTQYLFKTIYEGDSVWHKHLTSIELVKIIESDKQIIEYQLDNWKDQTIINHYRKKREDISHNSPTNFYYVLSSLELDIRHKHVTLESLSFQQLSNCAIRNNRELYVNLTSFAKYLDPVTVYNQIYNFLLSKKDKKIVDNRTDIQKLESAGFDRKTSFRKM